MVTTWAGVAGVLCFRGAIDEEWVLFCSDGTDAGTVMVKDITTPVSASGVIDSLTNVNGVVYFGSFVPRFLPSSSSHPSSGP